MRGRLKPVGAFHGSTRPVCIWSVTAWGSISERPFAESRKAAGAPHCDGCNQFQRPAKSSRNKAPLIHGLNQRGSSRCWHIFSGWFTSSSARDISPRCESTGNGAGGYDERWACRGLERVAGARSVCGLSCAGRSRPTHGTPAIGPKSGSWSIS